jgi:hypothetical protein
MAERRFGLNYSPPLSASYFAKPAMAAMPTMPKTPSFGKVPTLGKTKFGAFGKTATAAEVVEAPVAPVVSPVAEKASEATLSYKYIVFVAENDVEWAYDREYVVILQKPLGDKAPSEFLAMVGRKSVGPGKRYWVHSLCSAVVRAKRAGDDRRVDAGIDYVDVSSPANNWVVT